MAEAPSTSFIPKNTNRVRKPRVGKRIYIFSYISYVLFFGTLLTLAGTYLFSITVNGALEEQRQLLADERATFSEGEIAQVRDLEKRLLVANRLVGESSAPSLLFGSFESVIADTVQLMNFKYERLPGNSFILTFIGAMNEFDSAMFQRDLFRAAPALADAKVSTFTYGNVSESDDSSLPQTDQRLVVTFENTASTALIPYEPAAVSVFDIEAETEVVSEIGTSTEPATDENAAIEGTDSAPPANE